MNKKTILALLASSTILSVSAMAHCGNCAADKSITSLHSHSDETVVAVAAESEPLSTLVAAVKAAGLVETLQGKGPFTIFAPTNKAFEKLPAGTVEMLLKPENKAKLVAILTYHVVPGKVAAADVKTMTAKTVNGKSLDIKVTPAGVMVGQAKVIKTDLFGSNGVIHVVDTVILPQS